MKTYKKQLFLLAAIICSSVYSIAQVTGPPYTNIGAGNNMTLQKGSFGVDSGNVSVSQNGRRYQMADATGQHRSVLRYGAIGSTTVPANSNNIIFGNGKANGDIYMVTSTLSGVANEQNRLTIKGGGNIGLSTNAPTSLLDINGDLRIRVVPIDTTLDTVLVIDTQGNVRRKYLKCCCDTTTSPRLMTDYIELKDKFDNQALMIADLQNQINELKNSNNSNSTNNKGDFGFSKASIKLYQNNPNPFTEQTSIRYNIPKTSANASLLIFDMQGTQIKSIEISEFGEGAAVINGGDLKAGMYMYSLIINGKEVDTKRMILTR